MEWDMVADIGGTNMRVAQVFDGRQVARQDYPMTVGRDIALTLSDAASLFGGTPRFVLCAGAGTLRNGEIALTNGGWLVSETKIKAATGAARVYVINDFEAAAWSLATLGPEDVQPIGASPSLKPGHRVAVGPGTGLGVGTLNWDGTQYSVLPGEGGHVAIGPHSASEIEIFEKLRALWPKAAIGNGFMIEAEAALSGTGLPDLYHACGGQAGAQASDVFSRALDGDGPAARAISLFRHHLASLCGDLAVTVLARGGVFLVGGVAQANAHVFDEAFWAMYRDGGRFSDLRGECGLYLVTATDFGLQGCANALRARS